MVKQKSDAVKITLIISAVVLILAVGALFFIKSVVPSAGNMITVNGISKISANPDTAIVFIVIETKAQTAEKAKNANNEVYEKIKKALTSAGFEETDLKTEQFTVNENWEWNSTTSYKNGYLAQHFAQVSTKNISKTAKIIDTVVDNGGKISSINFELSQETENYYKAEALKLASQDAKKKAGAIASGLDKKLGSLVSVQASDFYYAPWQVFGAERAVAEKTTVQKAISDIKPTDLEISASVTVQYKIK